MFLLGIITLFRFSKHKIIIFYINACLRWSIIYYYNLNWRYTLTSQRKLIMLKQILLIILLQSGMVIDWFVTVLLCTQVVNYFITAFYDGAMYLTEAINRTVEDGADLSDGLALSQRVWNNTYMGNNKCRTTYFKPKGVDSDYYLTLCDYCSTLLCGLHADDLTSSFRVECWCCNAVSTLQTHMLSVMNFLDIKGTYSVLSTWTM